MKKLLFKIPIILLIAGLCFPGCKKKERPISIPLVISSALSNVGSTSAIGGGNISSNGGAEVTASGLCYSKTNNTPTIANDTTLTNVTFGGFTSTLKNLTPSTVYYVRAYAVNSSGTGYGEVLTFTTGNAAPMATNIVIGGKIAIGEQLTASFTYSDAENDEEDIASYQWFKANDAAGTGETAIQGATKKIYKVVASDEFKYLRVGITVQAKTGTVMGVLTKSAFTVVVAPEPTTVSFVYNGTNVSYNVLISSVTGRRWLDRNLGAPGTAIDLFDFANYGDLFQWGRNADGHQLILRGATSATTKVVNGVTENRSSSDSPGNNLFITTANLMDTFDWRNPKNDNLWQGVEGINNPCPAGWRLPTKAEIEAEKLNNIQNAFTQLKITLGGSRGLDGIVTGAGATLGGDGIYWTSTVSLTGNMAMAIYLGDGYSFMSTEGRGFGAAVRCIKD